MPNRELANIFLSVPTTGGAQLVVHFANSAFEMAHEFTRSTFPSRFTVPPASLDPSVPRPGPYLFNSGGKRTCSVLQFMPAASLRSTSSSPASSTSSVESSENSPTEGPVAETDVPLGRTLRFLLEIWRDKLWRESVQEKSLKMLRLPPFFQKLHAFAI